MPYRWHAAVALAAIAKPALNNEAEPNAAKVSAKAKERTKTITTAQKTSNNCGNQWQSVAIVARDREANQNTGSV